MKKLLILMIRLYQCFLSPKIGILRLLGAGQCRFTPNCSEYGKLAIEKYGAVNGILKGTCRILRCHPYSRGGVDLP